MVRDIKEAVPTAQERLYRPKSVLIVDDNQELRKIASESLEGSFETIESYSNSKKALDRLYQVEFDVLLTDIAMPDVSGLDLLATVQKLNVLTVPLVMTAYGNKENILRAYTLGCYDLLEKPFDPIALRHRSRNALARAQTQRLQIEMIGTLFHYLNHPITANLRSMDEQERLQIWQSALTLFKMRWLNEEIDQKLKLV